MSETPSAPVPGPAPGTWPPVSVAEVEDLRQQVQDLQVLLQASLVALLVLSVGLNLFLFYQMGSARAQLPHTRQVVQNLSTEYQRKEPNMRRFAAALESFALTHPDFNSILNRYRGALPDFFAQPAAILAPRGSLPSPVAPPSGASPEPGGTPAR